MSRAGPSNSSTTVRRSATGMLCDRGVKPTRSTNPTAMKTVTNELLSARAVRLRSIALSMCARKTTSMRPGRSFATSMASRLALASASSPASAWVRGVSTSARKIETAASAMRPSDDPTTRTKWSSGSSPKISTAALNNPKTSTSPAVNARWSGSVTGRPMASVRRSTSSTVRPALRGQVPRGHALAGSQREVAGDAGEMVAPVRVDHLVDRHALLGQPLQQREPLDGIGRIRIVEPARRVLGRVHTVSLCRRREPTNRRDRVHPRTRRTNPRSRCRWDESRRRRTCCAHGGPVCAHTSAMCNPAAGASARMMPFRSTRATWHQALRNGRKDRAGRAARVINAWRVFRARGKPKRTMSLAPAAHVTRSGAPASSTRGSCSRMTSAETRSRHGEIDDSPGASVGAKRAERAAARRSRDRASRPRYPARSNPRTRPTAARRRVVPDRSASSHHWRQSSSTARVAAIPGRSRRTRRLVRNPTVVSSQPWGKTRGSVSSSLRWPSATPQTAARPPSLTVTACGRSSTTTSAGPVYVSSTMTASKPRGSSRSTPALDPGLQRRCLELLEMAVAAGDAPPAHYALPPRSRAHGRRGGPALRLAVRPYRRRQLGRTVAHRRCRARRRATRDVSASRRSPSRHARCASSMSGASCNEHGARPRERSLLARRHRRGGAPAVPRRHAPVGPEAVPERLELLR